MTARSSNAANMKNKPPSLFCLLPCKRNSFHVNDSARKPREALTFPVGPEITYLLDTEEQTGASQGVLKPKLADKLCRSADPLSGS